MNFLNIFSKSKKTDILSDAKAPSIEELRTTFKARYHSFKMLLSANKKSLELMSDIERVLLDKQPFDMSWIRAKCTAISVSVFRMIQYLEELAPSKYLMLYDRFQDIKHNIDSLLNTKKYLKKGAPLVIPLSLVDRSMADLVGSKMANLGEIKNNTFIKVPEGFVITSAAYEKFIEYNHLQIEINRCFQSIAGSQFFGEDSEEAHNFEQLYALSTEIQQLITKSELPKELSEAILNAYQELEINTTKDVKVALRSSALGEDSIAKKSFAGQYRTALNVSSENILQVYQEIIASKYSFEAITYRINQGFKDEDISMCVGCMVMIDAVAGGVSYSRNPLDITDASILINSVWGLPKSVVEGRMSSDLFILSRESPPEIIYKEIKGKQKKFICLPQEGVTRIEIAQDSQNLPSLTDSQAQDAAELTIKIENYCSLSASICSPQDIEWALAPDGCFYILQCRPLQQMEILADYPKPTVDQIRFNDFYPKDLEIADKENILAKGGITASPGVACGVIYFVDHDVDLLRCPEGAVLVAEQALPKWAPLVPRAAALVTEQGSFAGHLATVAREYKKPALFGILGVRDKLTSGELITVDASGLKIYKDKAEGPLRIESLLAESKIESIANSSATASIEGSPVYDTLKEVSKFIVSLNLLNPEAPDFNPINCRTLHDITRFVHEKSVQEMFNFGKENCFSERSSKQLVYNIPMKWWVLNLDDGFKEEVEGKYVQLENIISTPMLALWKGITAIPWAGPPPLDGKGFISVLFQATTNTALNSDSSSRYTERNYFMISKNYCSLNTRLGFHFSIIEALIVGDRTKENYISFQFKGGAADFPRRHKRVLFVKEILEKYGFWVEVKEDHLIARIENQNQEFMLSRLVILGYLNIHTRQIDMIMSNQASVNFTRAKFEKDCDSIAGNI